MLWAGFLQRLENLEHENGHGKVKCKENEKLAKLAKCHGDQSWNFTNLSPEFYQIFALFVDIRKISIG